MHSVLVKELFEDWQHSYELPPAVNAVNRMLRRLRLRMRVSRPIDTGLMTSVEQRVNMFHLAGSVLSYGVPGAFVELGSHVGQSAVLFQQVIEQLDPGRELHVFDSFEGLPELTPEDGNTSKFAGGDMASTEAQLLANFARFGLEPPIIHKGWFEDTLATELPSQIAFAHLDGDLYSSTIVGLAEVYPRLSRGAVCLLDDYVDPDLYPAFDPFPGVKKACDEFMEDKPEKVSVLYAGYDDVAGWGSHGYFRKL